MGRCSAAVGSSLFAEVIHLDPEWRNQSAEVAAVEAVAAEEVEEQVELEGELARQSVWQDDRCHSL